MTLDDLRFIEKPTAMAIAFSPEYVALCTQIKAARGLHDDQVLIVVRRAAGPLQCDHDTTGSREPTTVDLAPAAGGPTHERGQCIDCGRVFIVISAAQFCTETSRPVPSPSPADLLAAVVEEAIAAVPTWVTSDSLAGQQWMRQRGIDAAIKAIQEHCDGN